MFLFNHEFSFESPIANLIAFAVIFGGWLVSVFLIVRGLYFFAKSEQKLKTIRLILILFAVVKLVSYILPSFFSILLTFPFGFFGGLPFLFIVGVLLEPLNYQGWFVYEISVLLGFILNIIGWGSLGHLISRRFG